jgi:hypothetical protein
MHIVKAKIENGKEIDIPHLRGIEIFGPDKDGNANIIVKGAASYEQAIEKGAKLLACFFLNRGKVVSCREISW